MTSVRGSLRVVFRQLGETGLQRTGRAERQCAATVTCRAWHGNRPSGRRAGEENATHWDLWVWVLGEQDCCGAGASSSGSIKGRNETQGDGSATNNQRILEVFAEKERARITGIDNCVFTHFFPTSSLHLIKQAFNPLKNLNFFKDVQETFSKSSPPPPTSLTASP